MKKIPIILVLLLTAVWAYTCWYWYTCNIKGFCDDDASYVISRSTDSESQEQSKIIEENSIQTESGFILEGEENSPKLSAKDVLFDPLSNETKQKTSEIEKTQEDKNELTESGSTIESTDEENTDSEIEDIQDTEQTGTICEVPLVGPISLSANNNRLEVERLEAFLISRGENISIDGSYGNDDFQAVKRFQLEYKADVLDPWDIAEPTGYVGRTSIAKINELACN